MLVCVLALSLYLFSVIRLIPCCTEPKLWLCYMPTIQNVPYIAEWSGPELRLDRVIWILAMRLLVVIGRTLLGLVILKPFVVDAFVHHYDVLFVEHGNVTYLTAGQLL